jgi:hypothetical protein
MLLVIWNTTVIFVAEAKSEAPLLMLSSLTNDTTKFFVLWDNQVIAYIWLLEAKSYSETFLVL